MTNIDFKKIENVELFKSRSELEQQSELIEQGIYTLEDNNDEDFFINPTLTYSIKTDNNVEIGEFFNHNNQYYYVNSSIYDSIYDQLGFIMYIHEEAASSLIERQIEHIITLIPKKSEAIEMLKNKRNEYLEKYLILMEEFPTFIDGLKQPESYGFESVDQLVIESIKEAYEIVSDFVLQLPLEDNKLTKLWIEIVTLESKITMINTKIDELNNFAPLKQNTLQNKIFKDDGEKIFIFLVNETLEEKNTAFFSYLYLFLRSQNKTGSKNYQNKAYREYVLKKSIITTSSYKSIQKTTDNNENKQYNIVNQFKIDLKKYYSQNRE
jgi:hypothetical protein